MQRTILDKIVDLDASHYICRVLADLLNSGISYLIVYQSYFFQKYLMGYRRKTPTVLLCKSIVISIQRFQILHIIAFSTIYNSSVLFSGARVSLNHSLVPQLHILYKECKQILNNCTV